MLTRKIRISSVLRFGRAAIGATVPIGANQSARIGGGLPEVSAPDHGAEAGARPQRLRLARLVQIGVPAAAVLIGVLLVIGPLVTTFVRSLITSDIEIDRFTLENFTKMFADPAFRRSVFNTFITGLSVTFFASVLGCALAWIVSRTEVPGRRWFEILNLVPFFFSPYVGAMSWLYLAAPHSGIVPKLLAPYIGPWPEFLNIYSIGGVVWVLTLFYTPYIYLFVIAPMRSMDGALEDAARVHGAGFWITTWRITVPLLMPSLLSGALIVFVTSAGLFDVPLSISAPRNINMIPTDIFRAVQYPADFGRASAMATLMMAVTIVFAVVQQRYINARRFDIVSGKGYRPRPIQLGPLGRAAALGLQLLYLLLATVLPLIALILVSISPIWTGTFRPGAATIANFQYVWSEYRLTQEALYNSLFVGIVGATLGVAIGALQAYYVRSRRSRLSRLVEPMLSLPLGIPGIIIGLGFLILLIHTPLYGTIWIIIIACVAHFFPLALRNMSAMLLALNPELEQSARASGATWWQSMRYVVLPLVRPALIAAWLMLFVIFIRELGATILLYNQGTETISIALVVLSEQNFGYVAALAVTQVAMLLGAFFLLQRTGGAFLDR